MAKVNLKTLKKYSKKLNKLDLTSEAIDLDNDEEELREEFISAIEEIDDDGQIDEVDENIVDFYETLMKSVKDVDDDDDDDDDDEDKKSKAKKGKDKKSKAKSKKKSKSKDEDEDEDEDEDDDDEDDDEDEDKKSKSKKSKKKSKKSKSKKSKKSKSKKSKDEDEDDDDEDDDDEDEDEDEEDEKPKGKKSKGKKGKGKKSKASKVKLPKGLRSGTLPGEMYAAILEAGEISWDDLAKMVAKIKDRKPEKCMSLAIRTISRKISKAVPIQAIFSGDDNAVFSIAGGKSVDVDDDDDDDDDDD
jgi:hypothetical protein